MIYFKISCAIDSDVNSSNIIQSLDSLHYISIVKIGYTDDNPEVAKNRDMSYRTENPSIIHYKYILGGTREDESLIHLFLKDYLYAGREWFKLTPEVIEFIENVETIEDVREAICDVKSSLEINKNYKEKSEVLYKLIPAIIPSLVNKFEYYIKYYEISNTLRSLVKYSDSYEDDILDVVRELYFDEYKNILNRYEINKSYSDSIFILKYSTLTNFIDKMKFLCNYVKDGNNIDNIQFLIDDDVINFYLVLGVEKIESHSYIRIRLDREINKLINNQLIDPSEEIYNRFQVGKKYNKPFIKSELKSIYDSLGYKRTPKATDLDKYFELRYVKYVENGKKVNGFEILSRKL